MYVLEAGYWSNAWYSIVFTVVGMWRNAASFAEKMVN